MSRVVFTVGNNSSKIKHYCCFLGRESFMSDSVAYPPRQAFLYSHRQRLRRVLNHPTLLARKVHGHQ